MPAANPIPARRRRLRTVGYHIAYAVLGLIIVGWALKEQGIIVLDSDRCELSSEQGFEFSKANAIYTSVLAAHAPALSDSVVTVGIDASLGIVQQNICTGRAFMADLLTALTAPKLSHGQPAVIAIDKFYSQSSCPDGDPDTQTLKDTAAGLSVPFIVGASTTPAEQETDGACLVATPQLFLSPDTKYGLTRLNQDVLELPLQWRVLPSATEKKAESKLSSTPSPSFAVTAAQIYTVATAHAPVQAPLQSDRILDILTTNEQPYANVSGKLTDLYASDILCSDAEYALRDTWKLGCNDKKDKTTVPDLTGKLIVIGAESETDHPTVLGKPMYGFQLQAHYIAALLSGSYMRALPLWSELTLLLLYYVIAELLLPYMDAHNLFHIEYLFLWKVAFLAITLAAIYYGSLAISRLPPLGLLCGMILIFIPHLLVESWDFLVESKEHQREDSHT